MKKLKNNLFVFLGLIISWLLCTNMVKSATQSGTENTVYLTASLPIRLVDYYLESTTSQPGNDITLVYVVNNDDSTNKTIYMGATITHTNTGGEYNDTGEEQVLSRVACYAWSYTSTRCSRKFHITSTAPSGIYNVAWGLWTGQPGYSNWVAGGEKKQYLILNANVTISSNTPGASVMLDFLTHKCTTNYSSPYSCQASNISGGWHRFTLSKENYNANTIIQNITGNTTIQMDLDFSANIIVKAPDDSNLCGATVYLDDTEKGTTGWGWLDYSYTCFLNVPALKINATLKASYPDYQSVSQRITGTGNQVIKLRGYTVTISSNTPGAFVYMDDIHRCTTSTSGYSYTCQIDGISGQQHTFQLTKSECSQSVIQNITGNTNIPLNCPEPIGSLKVTVKNANGSTVSGAAVKLYNPSTTPWTYLGSSNERISNSYGIAEWSGLTAGTYAIEVYYGEFWGNNPSIVVSSGQTSNITGSCQ